MTSDRPPDMASGNTPVVTPCPPFRIGVTTRALFDLQEEHAVFCADGAEAYAKLQRAREEAPLAKGAGFGVVNRLLGLNDPDAPPLVEVVLLSRNTPDLALRAMASIRRYGLDITTGSFTSGRPIAGFLPAWGIDLFLSNEAEDVRNALACGIAAAILNVVPDERVEDDDGEVRIAFDGDAVVFSPQSEAIFQRHGMRAFVRHEVEHAKTPMKPGPFGGVLRKLSMLRRLQKGPDGRSRVRIAIVTARSAPAHERVIHTLRAWDTLADEAHFVGDGDKGSICAAFGAHILFDDQERHIRKAQRLVAAAHVPEPDRLL